MCDGSQLANNIKMISAELSRLSSSSSPPLCHRESAPLPVSLRLVPSLHPAPHFLSHILCLSLRLLYSGTLLRRITPSSTTTTTTPPPPPPTPHTAALFSGWSYPRVLLLSLHPVQHHFPPLQKAGQRTQGGWIYCAPCSLRGSYIHAFSRQVFPCIGRQMASSSQACHVSNAPPPPLPFSLPPQIPASGGWGEVVGGPQRSLKQQLQADAGTDSNRTRRLLFITSSSTEPKHFGATSQSRATAATQTKKREGGGSEGTCLSSSSLIGQ